MLQGYVGVLLDTWMLGTLFRRSAIITGRANCTTVDMKEKSRLKIPTVFKGCRMYPGSPWPPFLYRLLYKFHHFSRVYHHPKGTTHFLIGG